MTETRSAASARRRRDTYQPRLAAADEPRKALNALVGWWMAEWYRLPAVERAVEFDRLRQITVALNEKAAESR